MCKEIKVEPRLWGDDELREDGIFCRAFLRTMDPERAAAESGRRDGFSTLKRRATRELLEEMRVSTANQIRKEDVIRRLAQLAFGRANDAVSFALHPEKAEPDAMVLSAVAEFKVTDKGGQCRRVIYTPGQSTWAAMRYTGEYQIQKSREEEKIVTVTMPGSFLTFPGERVILNLERMGLNGEFRVSESENDFSVRHGATVTLTLKEVA